MTTRREQWEYKTVSWDDIEMNRAGQQGWEAVGIITIDQRDTYGNEWQEQYVTMKRRKRRTGSK